MWCKLTVGTTTTSFKAHTYTHKYTHAYNAYNTYRNQYKQKNIGTILTALTGYSMPNDCSGQSGQIVEETKKKTTTPISHIQTNKIQNTNVANGEKCYITV